MEKHENVSQRSRSKMILDNFIGGISWALGVWVGATLVIALLVFILSKVNYIPLVGDFIVNILKYIGENSFRVGR